MSLLKSNAVQVGQSLTATNNFTLYQPSVPDGTVRLGVGNSGSVTDVLTVTSAGNVIVGGTSTVYGAANRGVITINGASTSLLGFTTSGADKGFLFHDGTNMLLSNTVSAALLFQTANTERMRIDSAGNVGIGVTSPLAALDVFRTGGSNLSITHSPTGGTYPKASGIGFGATSTALTVASNGGTISFTGGAGIYANNSASSGNPTSLAFWTTLGGTPAERMRIDSVGLVGIGTNNPGQRLEVFDSADVAIRIHKGGVAQWNIGVDTLAHASTDGASMAFRTGNSERMRLNSTQGLSVGTSGASSLGSNTRFTSASGGTTVSVGSMSGSGTGATDTGIPVNQGSYGGTLLLMCSTNFSDLGGTVSAVFMVQLYFSGNLTPGSTAISGSTGQYTIGRSANNTLTITSAQAGNHSYAWIGNK